MGHASHTYSQNTRRSLSDVLSANADTIVAQIYDPSDHAKQQKLLNNYTPTSQAYL